MAFWRDRDSDLDHDIQAHLDLLAAEHERRGLSPKAAREAARRDFGGVEQMKERYRDQRGFLFIDSLGQDLLYAIRTFRRFPVFTICATASLALGIGAATIVFSVMNAVALRALPAVPDPERLVLLAPYERDQRFVLFNPEFEELRRRQRSLTDLFAVTDSAYVRATIDADPPRYLAASLVSGSYFDVLELTPGFGRLLANEDDAPVDATAQPCAAVISDAFWSNRFGRRPDAMGRTISVRNQVCVIVGVTPPGFKGHRPGFTADVWLPLRRLTERRLLAAQTMAFYSGVMGRLRQGLTREQAASELTTLYQQIQTLEPPRPGETPQDPAALSIRVSNGAPGLDMVRQQYGQPLALLLGAIAVVLLIAASNVANLLIARGASRLPELTTRTALGAGRGRILRQLATEGSLLALAGGLIGVSLGVVLTPPAAALVFQYGTTSPDVSADGRVMTVAALAITVVTLIVALVPAVRLSESALRPVVASERMGTQRARRRIGIHWLLVGQFALCLVLVTAAGLLMRSFTQLSGVELGFQPDATVVMLSVADESPGPGFAVADTTEARARRATEYARLDEVLNALPGVRSASLSWLGLFSPNDMWTGITGVPPVERPLARVDFVSARYFETVGMQVVSGRGFDGSDSAAAPRVAVINEALARTFFAGRNVIGAQIGLDRDEERDRPFTVIGVVRDSRYNSVREDGAEPMMWMPIVQAPFRITSVVLRTSTDAPADIVERAAAEIRSLDPYLMVRRVTTLEDQVAGATATEWLLSNLAGAFSTYALILTALGLYGTLAYSVTRRTREIGLRMALGARKDAVAWMVLRDASVQALVAVSIGIPVALAVASSLRRFLFGVAPQDPATLAIACGVLMLVAIIAACVPAGRAMRVNPVIALRAE